ncbi:MAG: tetratricopeptide repeat protein [Bacteroidales bacterium]
MAYISKLADIKKQNMKHLIFGFIIIIAFSCQHKKTRNKPENYLKLALDTMNYSVNNRDKIDFTSKSRLLIANSLLDSCIRIDSSVINAYYWKSQFLIQLKDYSQAFETASRGIAKCSKGKTEIMVKLYVQRGVLSHYLFKKDSSDDLNKALMLYNKIIKNKPDCLDAIMNKSMVLCYMNKKDEAIKYLKSIKNKKIESQTNDLILKVNNFNSNKIFENN